jgi:hypothetical protein
MTNLGGMQIGAKQSNESMGDIKEAMVITTLIKASIMYIIISIHLIYWLRANYGFHVLRIIIHLMWHI